MFAKGGFTFGKVGVIATPTVGAALGNAKSRLGDCPDHDCPLGYARNAAGVCVIPQPVGTTYFVRTLAGARPWRK